VELNLYTPFHAVPDLFRKLKSLKFLDFLSLYIWGSQEYPPFDEFEPLGSITRLALTVREEVNGYEPFSQIISRLFPSLSELTLQSKISVLQHTLRQDGFENLSSLIFYANSSGAPSKGDTIKIPSNVKAVRASLPLDWFWQLRCPSATTLWVLIGLPINPSTLMETPVIESSAIRSGFPSIQHLTSVAANPWDFIDHCSRTLQEITIDLRGTAFCCSLALQPHSLPVLSRLNLKRHPSWDIFFIMLERRNLFSRSVSPISSLKLPPTYPRALFRPIRDLLRQKIPDRPSNWELSDTRASERVLDLTM
jgi:hypothetical protein